MGTNDWIFKGTKLIANTKKQILKIKSRDYTLKNTILKTTEQNCKSYIKNMKLVLKIGFFFSHGNNMF